MKLVPPEERPRERLVRLGSQALSNAELLAILLRTGTKELPVQRLAENLVQEFEALGLGALAQLSAQELQQWHGIGSTKAITLLAAVELGKRMVNVPAVNRLTIRNPQDVADLLMPRLRFSQQEQLFLLLLSTKNHLLDTISVSAGGLNASVVDPRLIFKKALQRSNAAGIILAHNHPSGDPTPSAEDIVVTRKLAAGGKILDVPLLDHIIIGDNCYKSLKELRLLE